MPDHILSNLYIGIRLPVVYLKLQSQKLRDDGARAGLCLDWQNFDAGPGLDDREGDDEGAFPDGTGKERAGGDHGGGAEVDAVKWWVVEVEVEVGLQVWRGFAGGAG